jgi:hypothetical protein
MSVVVTVLQVKTSELRSAPIIALVILNRQQVLGTLDGITSERNGKHQNILEFRIGSLLVT